MILIKSSDFCKYIKINASQQLFQRKKLLFFLIKYRHHLRTFSGSFFINFTIKFLDDIILLNNKPKNDSKYKSLYCIQKNNSAKSYIIVTIALAFKLILMNKPISFEIFLQFLFKVDERLVRVEIVVSDALIFIPCFDVSQSQFILNFKF